SLLLQPEIKVSADRAPRRTAEVRVAILVVPLDSEVGVNIYTGAVVQRFFHELDGALDLRVPPGPLDELIERCGIGHDFIDRPELGRLIIRSKGFPSEFCPGLGAPLP